MLYFSATNERKLFYNRPTSCEWMERMFQTSSRLFAVRTSRSNDSAAICTRLGVSVHQMEINIPKACVKTINCQRPLRVKGSVMKAIKKLERSLKWIQQPESTHTRAIAIYYCFTHYTPNSVAATFGDEITFINAYAMNNWLIAQWCRGWQKFMLNHNMFWLWWDVDTLRNHKTATEWSLSTYFATLCKSSSKLWSIPTIVQQ